MTLLRFALPGLRAVAVALTFCLVRFSCPAAPLGTAFTYQGRLNESGIPVTGQYDFQFSLWNSPTNGHVLAPALVVGGLSVTNGLFAALLDFGAGPVSGDALWLRIGVKPTGADTPFQVLSPRQPLTPAPYALWAASAGSAPASALTGTVADTTLSSNVVLLSSGGAGLTNVTAARLATDAAAAFAPAWTNNQTLWVDAVYGNDANHGLTPYAPVQSIARLLTINQAGYTLRFAPGTYYIPTNSPLVLSNNTAVLHGVTISDTPDNNAPGATSIPCVILINGPATLYGGTIVAQSTNTQDFPIQFNGTYPLTNVVLEGVTTIGYSDGTGISGAYTWTQPLNLTEKACSHFSYWDCFSTGPATGAATNSVIRFQACDFTSDATALPPQAWIGANRGELTRGLAVGGGEIHLVGCSISVRGGSTGNYGLTCNGIANPGPLIFLAGTEIRLPANASESDYAILANGYSRFVIDGHPYPDNRLKTFWQGSIQYSGSDSVYAGSTTNAPANGSTPAGWVPVNVGGTEYRLPVYK